MSSGGNPGNQGLLYSLRNEEIITRKERIMRAAPLSVRAKMLRNHTDKNNPSPSAICFKVDLLLANILLSPVLFYKP